jgi:hypothetical protein
MSQRIRGRVTFANVMSVCAVFIALGGTSYAALTLPKNSVGSKQIKKGAVRSSDVKNRALRAVDFKQGQLPAGARGPQGVKGDKGDKGETGAPGAATAFARINANGSLEANPALVKGIEQANIQHNPGAGGAELTGTGVYCIGGLPFTPRSAQVSNDNADAALTSNEIVSVIVFRGEDLGRCDAAHGQARVSVMSAPGTSATVLADKAFYIWFEA